MEEISKKIAELLQDPNRMAQITEMASAMGLTEFPEIKSEEQPQLQNALETVTEALRQTEAQDQRQQMLMRALLPYLSPKRKIKLERAMQITQISRLANVALRSTALSGEEEFRV